MLPRHAISDEHWERVKDFLPGQEGDPGVTAENNRLFVDGVLWIAKTGAQWRDLPERFGKWNSVWRRSLGTQGNLASRFSRVARSRPGVVNLGFQRHSRPPACGGGKKRGTDANLNQQALGRSRGGFSTKLHVLVNGLGLPVDFKLTPGQTADITQAEALLQDHDFEMVLGDKGFDSKKLIDYIKSRGAEPVIPPRSNLKDQREFDQHLYKERNLVERFINRIKQFRRVATRYEKTARNFLAFVQVAAITVLLQ